jgi:hypothetical protein
MSYTHCTSSASCEVAEDFDLKEYLTSLTDFVGNHLDDLPASIQWLGDYEHAELIDTFEDYVRESGGKILIEFDSEEKNHDSDVWDWLCNQIREDVMTSNLMQINYSTYDSKYGVECGTSYYMKDGRFIGSDEIGNILEQYIKMSS